MKAMWLVGHAALAYLIIKAGQALIPPWREGLRPRSARAAAYLFLLIAIFANLPDYGHLRILRPLSHSAIAIAVIVVVLWWVFRRFLPASRWILVTLLVAAESHILMDAFTSQVFPVWPFSPSSVAFAGSIIPFNSLAEIAFELVLIGLMILQMVFAKDWQASTRTGRGLVLKWRMEEGGYRNLLDPTLLALIFLTGFTAASILIAFLFFGAAGLDHRSLVPFILVIPLVPFLSGAIRGFRSPHRRNLLRAPDRG